MGPSATCRGSRTDALELLRGADGQAHRGGNRSGSGGGGRRGRARGGTPSSASGPEAASQTTRGATIPVPAAAPPREDPRCPEATAALLTTTTQLIAAQTELRQREEQRVAREGVPAPIASGSREPRFTPEVLRQAVSDALTQTHVPGRVDGLDCTEWPCVIYGRIRGTEDEMEKLEGAKALAAYERDVLTVLLWVATDEAANEGPLPILPGRPEQSLFAFAFYPRGLERPIADNLDRRLRTRAAALWNTMSPADETGR